MFVHVDVFSHSWFIVPCVSSVGLLTKSIIISIVTMYDCLAIYFTKVTINFTEDYPITCCWCTQGSAQGLQSH